MAAPVLAAAQRYVVVENVGHVLRVAVEVDFLHANDVWIDGDDHADELIRAVERAPFMVHGIAVFKDGVPVDVVAKDADMLRRGPLHERRQLGQRYPDGQPTN